jgi:outer membrane protein OmpA-like peptidoglycan-associated protein
MKHIKSLLAVLLVSVLLLQACNWSRTAKGGVIGAGVGGAVGGIIGNKAGNTAVGAIIGAAVGGAAGASIGRYMDKQAEELQRDLKNAKVERVGEGIKITFESGILFDIDSDQLKAVAKNNINDLSKTLNKYKDTNVLIEGHTDNTGTEQHNQVLSDKRAASVSRYLTSQGVAAQRVSEKGYGPSQPVADNSSESGRRLNRRVEIAIWANEKLKRAAKNGDIK